MKQHLARIYERIQNVAFYCWPGKCPAVSGPHSKTDINSNTNFMRLYWFFIYTIIDSSLLGNIIVFSIRKVLNINLHFSYVLTCRYNKSELKSGKPQKLLLRKKNL